MPPGSQSQGITRYQEVLIVTKYVSMFVKVFQKSLLGRGVVVLVPVILARRWGLIVLFLVLLLDGGCLFVFSFLGLFCQYLHLVVLGLLLAGFPVIFFPVAKQADFLVNCFSPCSNCFNRL